MVLVVGMGVRMIVIMSVSVGAAEVLLMEVRPYVLLHRHALLLFSLRDVDCGLLHVTTG